MVAIRTNTKIKIIFIIKGGSHRKKVIFWPFLVRNLSCATPTFLKDGLDGVFGSEDANLNICCKIFLILKIISTKKRRLTWFYILSSLMAL